MTDMPDRTQAPPTRPFPPLVIPAETVEYLDNGARLHIYRGGNQPLVRIALMYEGGKAELGAAASRIIASQLTEGTELFDSEELADLFDFNGVRTGATVSDHFTSIELNVLANRLGNVLPAFHSMVACPMFPDTHLQVAKMQLIAGIQSRRLQPAALASDAFMAMMFGKDHHLAHVIDEHEIETINSITLRQLHCSHICNEGLDLYVCGNFDDNVLGSIRDFALSLPDLGCRKFVPVMTEVLPANEERHIPFESSLQSAVNMGLRTINRSSPDYIDLRLAVMALGGYFGSRLMKNIREEKGMTYGIYASLAGGYDGAYMNISAQCDKKYTSDVVDEIRKELNLLASNPPCGEELERLRSYALSSLADTLDTPQNISAYYSTQRLVGTPGKYFALQQRAIDALTPERIAALAAVYLSPDKLATVTVG